MAPAMEMSSESVKQYTLKMRERYSRMTGRQAKGVLLDEFIKVTGHERKYAIKVLGGSQGPSRKASRQGRRPHFGPAVDKALKTLWQEMDQPCGKRMRNMLPLWVGHMKGIQQKTRDSLLEMSPSTIDRKLRDYKVGTSRKIRPPRGENAIKAQVEIRAESWDVGEPGWTEIDTVAHYGGDMSGNFIWTLTCVDIVTGWTEVRPVWNRGQYTTLQGLEQIRAALPFDLLGIDSDNGGEFLNHHLFNWAKTEKIKQTRSRPYRKNDQAHVEQKNFTHVRQLLGYDRLEHPELVAQLTELLTLWSLWKNLYHATMEQTSSRREGNRQIRTHAKRNRTPAQRLLESHYLIPEKHKSLEQLLKTTNPFEMKAEIEDRLEKLWTECEHRNEADAEKSQEAPESDLAPEGRTPLRSVQPSGAKERTTNQVAMVSR